MAKEFTLPSCWREMRKGMAQAFITLRHEFASTCAKREFWKLTRLQIIDNQFEDTMIQPSPISFQESSFIIEGNVEEALVTPSETTDVVFNVGAILEDDVLGGRYLPACGEGAVQLGCSAYIRNQAL